MMIENQNIDTLHYIITDANDAALMAMDLGDFAGAAKYARQVRVAAQELARIYGSVYADQVRQWPKSIPPLGDVPKYVTDAKES